MITKLKQLIMKLESVLPIEIGLSVSYEGCLIVFTGRLSRTVHFKFLKEHEDIKLVARKFTPAEELEFPLITPIKYAEPLDKFTARRIRAQIDRAVLEMAQTSEISEMKRLAKENNSDQEVTLKVA